MIQERISGGATPLAAEWQLVAATVYPETPDYLFDADSWPRNEGQPGAGRGNAFFVGDETGDYVLRHYRRGGMVAAISSDRYVASGADRSRAFREWRLLAALRDRGLPVPEPVAARYRRSGIFYTADLLTRRIADTETLAAWLARSPLPAPQWLALGALLKRFHDHGACHADLNAHNILLGTGDAMYLLDFDRGSLRPPGDWCDANLLRLRRSLDKLSAAGGLHFAEADWASLERGYEGSSSASEA